ncbi:MAG: ATP-binding protein [Phycisphaerales bacterium]
MSDAQTRSGGGLGVRALEAGALRWRCDPGTLGFATTADVEGIAPVIGQESAVEALEFGLSSPAPGHNIFVRGLTGTGRAMMVRRLMEHIKPSCPLARDRVYVRNFGESDRPRLLTFARGTAREFARLMHDMADYIRDDMTKALNSEAARARRSELEQETKGAVSKLTEPFEQELRGAGLAMMSIQGGEMMQTAILPVMQGRPVSPEEFEKMRAEGRISEADYKSLREKIHAYIERLEAIGEKIQEVQEKHAEKFRRLLHDEIERLIRPYSRRILSKYPDDRVRAHLKELIEDVASQHFGELEEGEDFSDLYRVNVVLDHSEGGDCPIVIENAPTAGNLLGSIDVDVGQGGMVHTDHMMIRAGSILRADGGYLLIEARDVLSEPGAWQALKRTLRSGKLEIVPSDQGPSPWAVRTLKPEPIDVTVKVVLIGDSETFFPLDQLDEDFGQLFKVLADFDDVIDRDGESARQYAGVIAGVAKEGGLPAFDAESVAALVEHGARMGGQRDKLTARMSRVSDVAREAAFLAQGRGATVVVRTDVLEAVKRRKRRASLPARRFREMVRKGTLQVCTRGTEIGQVNGLAVIGAGPITYGFPQRITATIGPGEVGVINIEREAELSGSIHTKGFYILSGLLRYLLRTDHPLTFDASIAFEQSYGGIDGDSASGAEMCCLLSALTEIPMRQDLAMTGAIDQRGQVMAIGAVNEKIEGFFDACADAGLTGTQGVIIPASNAGDLMLRHDVVDACREGKFAVYAVSRIHEALELFLGRPAGERKDLHAPYDEGTVLAGAVARARSFWKASRAKPE